MHVLIQWAYPTILHLFSSFRYRIDSFLLHSIATSDREISSFHVDQTDHLLHRLVRIYEEIMRLFCSRFASHFIGLCNDLD